MRIIGGLRAVRISTTYADGVDVAATCGEAMMDNMTELGPWRVGLSERSEIRGVRLRIENTALD